MIQIAGGILIALAVICLLPVIAFALWVLYRLVTPDMTPEQIAKIEASIAENERIHAPIPGFLPDGRRDPSFRYPTPDPRI